MGQPSFFHVLKSVLAAFIGVQSKENQEVDFTQGKASHYIMMGIIFTILFILTLVWIVSKVIGA